MQSSDDMRYLKRKFHKNQSPIGIFLDALALRLLFFLTAFLFFRRRVSSLRITLILALISLACFGILLHVINSFRYEAFVSKAIHKVRQELFFSRLWLLSEEDLRGLASPLLQHGEFLFILRRIEPASGDDILQLAPLESAAALFSTAGFTDGALQFVDAALPCLRLIKPEQLLPGAENHPLFPSRQEARTEMEKRYAMERQKQRKAVSLAFSNTFPGKYFLSAALLILLSFFTGYALYYRLLAMLSATIALVGAALSRSEHIHPTTDQNI